MRGRPDPPDLSVSPRSSSDAPIAATPAQFDGMMGRGRSRSIPWKLLSFLGEAGGFILLFVGTLVAVIAGSFPADCFTTHCTASTSAGIQNAILASRILWSLGAFGLAGGAGIELQFLLQNPESNSPQENDRYLARRRAAFVMLLFGIGVLFVLTLTAGIAANPAI
jgi:multisubunit Na+/H+ antiporter MnhB subunit